MAEALSRPAWAEVDLDAIRHNTVALVELAAPAALCAVVKAGGYGHGAVADEADDGGYTTQQVAAFEEVRDALTRQGVDPGLLHASNSAGTIAHPGARYDLVRCGIALYGHAPSPALDGLVDLQPALSLK